MSRRRKNRSARSTVPARGPELSAQSARVRHAYDQNELTRILTLPESEFGAAFGMETVQTEPRKHWGKVSTVTGQVSADTYDEGSYYHYKDNGSDVLAVAHLDTVVEHKGRIPRYYGSQEGPVVVSGALDDRLGAYVILDLLPKLGVNCDWLFTVDEESGQSTASDFTSDKDYGHVIEFDRGGTDVVMYQYDDAPTRELVRAAGAKTGHGSFSDIAYLDQLGVKCLNWGVGYEGNYHSEQGFAPLNNTFAMVAQYLKFSEQNAGCLLVHDKEEEYSSSYYPGSYRWAYGSDYKWTYTDFTDERAPRECPVCFALDVDPDTSFCNACDSCEECQMAADDCQCYTSHALSGKPLTVPSQPAGSATLALGT